jgi:hypothetical protein
MIVSATEGDAKTSHVPPINVASLDLASPLKKGTN